MLGKVLLLSILASAAGFGAAVQLPSTLPGGAVSRVMQFDAAGNIYLAGSVTPPNPTGAQTGPDAFVAKLSPDGSKLIYFTAVSGSQNDDGTAMAVGADGSVYLAGNTNSPDLPVTAGALQSKLVSPGASQGFLAKLSPAGAIVYVSYINGIAFTTITGMALGKAGEVFLTGLGGPLYSAASNQPEQGFILKLDPSLSSVQLSLYGLGAGLITLDSQGNIYLAGAAVPTTVGSGFPLPPFPAGAFQATHGGAFCTIAGGGPSPGFSAFCQYQFVAKLDPAGKLIWGTYVTGTYGAIPAGMAVDSAGNVIVAGTTNSDDYPVTAGAFQTAYTAAAPLPPTSPTFTGPPNSIGYITKVNAGGASLAWSTYFGGSYQDQITGMALSPSGDIIVSGRAGSNDLYFADIPDGCRPTPNLVLGYVGRLSSNGAAVSATQPILGVPSCLYLDCLFNGLAAYQRGWPVAARADGTAVVAAPSGTLAAVDFTASSRIGCLTDPADNAQVNSVAPGELISIFGVDLASNIPFIPGGGVAQSTDNFGVFFNGVAAPILYASAQQINVQVPFEIAGAGTVKMQVINRKIVNAVSETRTVAVVDRQPAIFLSPAALLSPVPGYSTCGGAQVLGQSALAINADGTVNDCTNPATAGSTVTVFLNGFGVTTPALGTGVVATAPPISLTPSLDAGPFTGSAVIATRTTPGAITGVAQVQVRSGGQATLFNGASLAGVAARERVIQIWIR